MANTVTLTMNPTVDVSSTVGQVVADRKLRCGAPLRQQGGGGINESWAIGYLGGTSTAVYPVGGATRDLLAALLRDETAIDTAPVAIADWTRESSGAQAGRGELRRDQPRHRLFRVTRWWTSSVVARRRRR